MSARLNPSALLGAEVRWLLDLEWAGQTIRLSDVECDVATKAGKSLHYHGGILGPVRVTEAIDFLADASASSPSASLAVILPSQVAVAKMIAQGHDLGAMQGSLSRWIVGTTWESRRVLVDGVATDPEHGSSEEPISFTLEAAPWAEQEEIPAASLAVLGENWDDAMITTLGASELGLMYPIVVGQPGQVSTAVWSTGRVTATQGVYVAHSDTFFGAGSHLNNVTLLVAGHHVTAESIYLSTSTYTTALRFKVINTHDRQGHPVAVCPWWLTKSPDDADDFEYDVSNTYTTGLDAGSHAFFGSLGDNAQDNSFQPEPGVDPVGTYCIWQDDDNADAGGMAGNSGGTMRAAGEVLEWLMQESGVRVDRGRFAAVKPLLSAYLLDFTIDARVRPWDYITANILPLLPLSLVSGPGGVYPVVWRYDATADDAVCHLDTGVDPYIERASAVSYDRSGIINDFTLSYALSLRSGNYLGSLRYGTDTDETGRYPNLWCNLSQRRYARADGSPLVVSKEIQSQCIYSDSTAHAVLQWQTRAYALARRRVEYIAPEASYGWLERGQVVTITDADLHYKRQVALVEAIETDGSSHITLKLLLIEDLPRDSRLA